MYRRVAGSNVPPPTSVKSTFIDSGLRREKSFFPFNVCTSSSKCCPFSSCIVIRISRFYYNKRLLKGILKLTSDYFYPSMKRGAKLKLACWLNKYEGKRRGSFSFARASDVATRERR